MAFHIPRISIGKVAMLTEKYLSPVAISKIAIRIVNNMGSSYRSEIMNPSNDCCCHYNHSSD